MRETAKVAFSVLTTTNNKRGEETTMEIDILSAEMRSTASLVLVLTPASCGLGGA